MDTYDLVEALISIGDRLNKDQSPNNDTGLNLLRINITPLWYKILSMLKYA